LRLRHEVFSGIDELVTLKLVLLVVELPVTPISREQFFVSSAFDDLTVFQHQDLIAATNLLIQPLDGGVLSGVTNLWIQPLSGGPPKQLTNFTSENFFSVDWSRDGKLLAMGRGTTSSDAVLISDFR
jgi:hypothetical protein